MTLDKRHRGLFWNRTKGGEQEEKAYREENKDKTPLRTIYFQIRKSLFFMRYSMSLYTENQMFNLN